MSTYADYQSKEVSEKIALATVEASKRLIGWVLHSGSIYKITSFNHPILVSISDSGTAYTSVGDVGSVTAGTYFHDTTNQILYLRASDSSNPNTRFLALTFKLFFANVPVIAPNDLSSGADVEWVPLIKSTSLFGLELDSDPNQTGIAVESSGQIEFHNDKTYWRDKYDKYIFDNNKCAVYSWSRSIPITEAKLIFKGKVQGRAYSVDSVSFQLKDAMNELRGKISLSSLSSMTTDRIPLSQYPTKQRLIYGYAKGVRLQNIDQIVDGFYYMGVTKTLTVVSNVMLDSASTDVAHIFRVGDLISITGTSIQVTVANNNVLPAVNNRIQITPALTQDELNQFTGAKTFSIKPITPRPYMNRQFAVSHTAVSQPTTTLTGVVAPNIFQLASTAGFEAGMEVVFQSFGGSVVRTIDHLIGADKIKVIGTYGDLVVPSTIFGLAITNVRVNKEPMVFAQDYTYNANGSPISSTIGVSLVLEEIAEVRRTQASVISTTASSGTYLIYQAGFAPGCHKVLGVGTRFLTELTEGSWIEHPALVKGWPSPSPPYESYSEDAYGFSYAEIVQIVNDTELYVNAPVDHFQGAFPSFDVSVGTAIRFKTPKYFNEAEDVVSADVRGKTENNVGTGTFLKTAPQVVKDLLTRAGIQSADIDSTSFTNAQSLSNEKFGLVIPDDFHGRTTITHRAAIDQVNRSVLGALIQDENFKFKYELIRPNRIDTIEQFKEEDILSFEVSNDASLQAGNILLNYLFKEFDYDARESTYQVADASSNIARYLSKNEKTFEIDTLLIEEAQAIQMAKRWALILELARESIEFDTKLRGVTVSLLEKIDFTNSLLYERFASTLRRKIGEARLAEKNAFSSKLKIDDLGASLNRCAVVAEDATAAHATATDDEKLYSGFVTDDYGMISNDADTHNQNLIW